MRAEEEHDDSWVLYELCSMIVCVLKFQLPTTLPFRYPPAASTSRQSSPLLLSPAHFSPAAFGFLFLVISFALMLFGSVTFAIGLILAPWVVLFVLFFYVARIVSNLSELARAILSNCMAEEKEVDRK